MKRYANINGMSFFVTDPKNRLDLPLKSAVYILRVKNFGSKEWYYLYVGQTTCVKNRIGSHLSGNHIFHRIFFYYPDKQLQVLFRLTKTPELLETEKKVIRFLCPHFNRHGIYCWSKYYKKHKKFNEKYNWIHHVFRNTKHIYRHAKRQKLLTAQ